MSQSEEKLSKLFDKRWTVETYEIDGRKFPATDIGKDDCTIFYADHKVKSIDGGIILSGKWKYDPTLEIVTLFSDSTNETTEMKIYTITNEELVSQITTSEGLIMKIYMVNQTLK